MNVGRNFTEMTASSFEPSNESTVGMVLIVGYNDT